MNTSWQAIKAFWANNVHINQREILFHLTTPFNWCTLGRHLRWVKVSEMAGLMTPSIPIYQDTHNEPDIRDFWRSSKWGVCAGFSASGSDHKRVSNLAVRAKHMPLWRAPVNSKWSAVRFQEGSPPIWDLWTRHWRTMHRDMASAVVHLACLPGLPVNTP